MNTKRTSKAFIVRTAVTLFLLLLTSTTAWAETIKVPYFDSNGEHEYETTATITENAITDLGNGWYVISGNYSSSQTLTFTGDVNLILADNADGTITGANGIIITNGNLTIYGQSKGTGSLTIKTQGNGSTSGDGILAKNGKITINGGILSITADWYGITTANNDITINGGKITVTSTGENGIDATGNITITGGTVIANATTYGMAATGNITLGCTKDTDYIIANNYNKNININSGLSPLIVYIDTENPNIKNPTTYNNQATITPSVINNKIIAPDLFGISKGNTGTSSNPYTISTAGGLQLLAAYVNSGTIFDYFDKENYTYDDSVVDGVNVPHRVYRIKTKVTEHLINRGIVTVTFIESIYLYVEGFIDEFYGIAHHLLQRVNDDIHISICYVPPPSFCQNTSGNVLL